LLKASLELTRAIYTFGGINMFLADANLRVPASVHVRLRVALLERLVLKALLDMAREARGEVVTVTTAAVLRRAFPGLRLPPVYAQAAYALIKAALAGVCQEEGRRATRWRCPREALVQRIETLIRAHGMGEE